MPPTALFLSWKLCIFVHNGSKVWRWTSVFFVSKLFHILAFILRLALFGDKERFSAAVQWLGKNLRFDKLEDSPRKFLFSSLIFGQQLEVEDMSRTPIIYAT